MKDVDIIAEGEAKLKEDGELQATLSAIKECDQEGRPEILREERTELSPSPPPH